VNSKYINSIYEPSDFLNFSIEIAKNAGKLQMKYFGNLSSIQKKSTTIDLLTEADLKSEEYIIAEIQNKYPSHSILSEESNSLDNQSEYTWVIDPLDGTTNFVHNLPIFSVSIGLMKNNETICSVVYNPAVDKCFYAEKNKGAFLNNNQINTTSCNTLSDSLLATGFPYSHDDRFDLSFSLFKDFYKQTRGIRRLGTASLDLCFVAMGRFDGFYEYGLKPWDICAGEIIVKEAGGIVVDWDGTGKNPINGSRILAANRYIYMDMAKILSKKEYDLFID